MSMDNLLNPMPTSEEEASPPKPPTPPPAAAPPSPDAPTGATATALIDVANQKLDKIRMPMTPKIIDDWSFGKRVAQRGTSDEEPDPTRSHAEGSSPHPFSFSSGRSGQGEAGAGGVVNGPEGGIESCVDYRGTFGDASIRVPARAGSNMATPSVGGRQFSAADLVYSID
ncbi:hypothetical protein BV22DRAFT_1037086 [Leucogyrophana mollusca]|uniref:Uncharacterized protein n=1 Tax=Leucogyrophana mollusca TaxID=85980 RepID=A0ACB8BBG4_9AGAM|nr:hypothetical protein BV22DRAFT_1037086 [Leucogyrophana mollusca]